MRARGLTGQVSRTWSRLAFALVGLLRVRGTNPFALDYRETRYARCAGIIERRNVRTRSSEVFRLINGRSCPLESIDVTDGRSGRERERELENLG